MQNLKVRQHGLGTKIGNKNSLRVKLFVQDFHSLDLTTLKSINISLQDSLNDETEKNKEMNLKLQKQNDEQLKLQRDLDIEKNKVMKFVSLNVDRDHEILKEELATRILFCDRLTEFPNHLIDRLVDLERENQVLETEKQKLESFIDSLPRKWKDRLR